MKRSLWEHEAAFGNEDASLMKCAFRHMKRFASFICYANKHHGGIAAASFLPTGKYFISFAYQQMHDLDLILQSIIQIFSYKASKRMLNI